jgi:putative ABC transport system ATP-binding protein
VTLEASSIAVHRRSYRDDGDVVDLPVFDGVDLHLRPGDLRAVVGVSGSGKTTLLRALVGLTALARGSLTLDGRPLDRWEPTRWRRRVGMLPQRAVMLPGTVADNLAWPAHLRVARDSAAVQRDPGALLEALGLGRALLQRPASELSEGQGSRVALARAVLAGPSVLLLDEPTAALDEHSSDRVEAFVRSLADDGIAVLWVLHDPRRAEALPLPPLRLAGEGVA